MINSISAKFPVLDSIVRLGVQFVGNDEKFAGLLHHRDCFSVLE